MDFVKQLLVWALVGGVGCKAPAPIKVQRLPNSSHVLVVVNGRNPDSVTLGRYYLERRGIPEKNLVTLDVPQDEYIPRDQYDKLESQVRKGLADCGNSIDYIVLTKYVPILIRRGAYSVDGHLAAMDLNLPKVRVPITREAAESIKNPFFGKNEKFSYAQFHMYLVTRLDGYTITDAKKLVDGSLSARPAKGPFSFHGAYNRTSDSYGALQKLMVRANDVLKTKGFDSRYDDEHEFKAPTQALEGYVSWGSNDGAFDPIEYHKLRFQPGAIVETFVSTSGRTFLPTTGGQSLIADLVGQGVTGVKGYVNEPFTFAMAHPDILFDRYTSGFNLAESFYMASPVANWKDVVLGDPLCAPYAKAGSG